MLPAARTRHQHWLPLCAFILSLCQVCHRLQVAALDALVEVFALTFLADHASQQLQRTFPALIASSHPMPTLQDPLPTASAASPGDLDGFQWIAMLRCKGESIGGAIPVDLAATIGRGLAALHGTPLPQDSRGAPATFFKDEDAWREAVEGGGAWKGDGAWEPFLRFLSRKTKEVHADMFSSAELPRHLLEALEEYLPKVRALSSRHFTRCVQLTCCIRLPLATYMRGVKHLAADFSHYPHVLATFPMPHRTRRGSIVKTTHENPLQGSKSQP